MTRVGSTIGSIALLALFAGVLYLAFRFHLPAAPATRHQPGSTPPSALPQDVPDRGRRLAQIYCQGCHLFPEPALLDKASWENGALPQMMPWLGLAKPPLERRRNGEII